MRLGQDKLTFVGVLIAVAVVAAAYVHLGQSVTPTPVMGTTAESVQSEGVDQTEAAVTLDREPARRDDAP